MIAQSQEKVNGEGKFFFTLRGTAFLAAQKKKTKQNRLNLPFLEHSGGFFVGISMQNGVNKFLLYSPP